MQTSRRSQQPPAASPADELVLRVQARFNSAMHPDAIRFLRGVPTQAIPHTVALLIQLGAQAYEDLRNRRITVSEGAPSAAAPASPQSVRPALAGPPGAAHSNPVAALVTPAMAAEVFTRPGRPAPNP